MSTDLTTVTTEHPMIKHAGSSRSANSRVRLFVAHQGTQWYNPDLAAWRDALLASGKSPETTRVYLSTVRKAYHNLLVDNGTRDMLFAEAKVDAPNAGPADLRAMVQETITRIQNAVAPENTKVEITKKQDRADSEHLRLTRAQANALMAAPVLTTLAGYRNCALIALSLCTGVREFELVAVTVDDLRQSLGGELALLVRHGKGNQQRLIPYGELTFCLAIIDRWLRVARITEGPVFRGLYRGGKTIRPHAITTQAVADILAKYFIMIDGEYRRVRPHDLRRTYARLLYDAGVDMVAIQQNLGHSDIKTTLGYIGTLDADKRRPSAIYSFDLSRLR